MSHIQKIDAGRYKARYTTAGGQERSKTFKRKSDAERFLDRVGVAIQSGEWVDPRLGRITFGEWMVEWQRSRVNLRPSTLARDESHTNNHILPRWGSTPLARIDHLGARQWIADLSAKGLAPATVQKIHQIASMTMEAAVQSGLVAKSPFEGTPLPKVERSEMRFITPLEIARLASAFDPRYRDLVLVGSYSGLRIGELLALRASKVDLLQGQIEVAETLSEVKGHLHLGPPKTKRSIRRVPLPRPVMDTIADRVSTLGPRDLVFTAPEGGFVRLASFRRRHWCPAVAAAGLAPLRIHDMRHTAVALWIAAEASPNEIARRAGHASVVTVLDLYGHLLPGTEKQVTDRLAAMFEAADEGATDAEIRQFPTANS